MVTLPLAICVSSTSVTVVVESTVNAAPFSVNDAAASAGVITGMSFTGVMLIVPVRVSVRAVDVEVSSFVLAPSLKVMVKSRLGSVVLTEGSSLVDW